MYQLQILRMDPQLDKSMYWLWGMEAVGIESFQSLRSQTAHFKQQLKTYLIWLLIDSHILHCVFIFHNPFFPFTMHVRAYA